MMRMTPPSPLQSIPLLLRDMPAEIAYWRSGYPHRAFFSEQLQFERYLPTFAFAYKTFVPGQASQPIKVPEQLCYTYKDGTAACDRINWREAEMIISATWARLQAAARLREATLRRYAADYYSKRMLLTHDQLHAA